MLPDKVGKAKNELRDLNSQFKGKSNAVSLPAFG